MTTDPQHLITEHLDIWSAAVTTRSASGRGKNNKLELYGMKKLRELILELAVRGLLVPQDPNDEPASVLLKKIATEKARLIKAGKIKKQKKLPPISEDEKPFELPNSWKWVYFGEIAQHNAGKTLDSGRNTGELRNYLTTSNLYWGRFDLSVVRQMPIREDELDKCSAQKGDLLICEGGEAGRASVWNEDREICFQNHVHRARFYCDIDPYYAYRYFEKLSATGEINKYRKGVGISNMSGKALASITFSLPPLPEQQRIVAKVDELMVLCDQLEQQQETSISAHDTLVHTLLTALTTAGEQGHFDDAWTRIADHFDILFTTESSIEQLKQTILQLAVMGKLVPQNPDDEPASALLKNIAAEKARLIKAGTIKKPKKLPPISEDEKPFDLPDGWEWSRIDEISFRVVDCLHSTPKFKETGRLCIDTNCIRPGIVVREKIRFVDEKTFQERNRRMKPRKDDVLFSREGALLGIAVKVPDGLDFCLGQRMMIFRFNTCVKSDYFEHLLNSQVIRSQYIDKKITGAASPHLNIRDIRKLHIPLPPTEEQHRIVAKVDELMVLCDRLKERIKAARTTQQHLADAMAEQALG